MKTGKVQAKDLGDDWRASTHLLPGGLCYAVVFYRLHVVTLERCEELPHVLLFSILDDAREEADKIHARSDLELAGVVVTELPK